MRNSFRRSIVFEKRNEPATPSLNCRVAWQLASTPPWPSSRYSKDEGIPNQWIIRSM
jgi:hypothetical protein